MTRRTLTCLFMSLIFISGCTLMPKYTRPDAPVPEKWPDGTAYKVPMASLDAPLASDMEWRAFFTDKGLQQSIEMALAYNRDLRVAALNVQKARAYYRIKRADLLPTIDAAASGYRGGVPADLSGTGNHETVAEYRAELGITAWEIDFFGRIRSLKKAALERYLATESARRGAQIALVSEVANTYLTLAADRETLELARSTLETRKATYDLIRRRFEGGLAPELDLRQAQTRVAAAQVDVARYTELVARDRNALNLLVGTSLPDGLLKGTLSDIEPLHAISPGTASEILLNRPDILQAESLLKAANANIGAARAALFPRISLTSAFGTASADLSGLFEAGSDAWHLAPQAALPIFAPGMWAALDVSRVEKEIVLAQYEKAIQVAFKEVADALAQKGMLGEQINAQKSLVDATTVAYRLSMARYDQGVDTYLTVLDAQRSLYTAEQGLIALRLAELANQVRLYAVMGGGGKPGPAYISDVSGADQ